MIQTSKHASEITVIRPGVDRLTAQNCMVFKNEVVALINEGATHLIIDFAEVSFLDSSGLGVLIGILKKIGHRGEIAVSGLSQDVQQMFKICRMDRVFTSYQDAGVAVEAMSANA